MLKNPVGPKPKFSDYWFSKETIHVAIKTPSPGLTPPEVVDVAVALYAPKEASRGSSTAVPPSRGGVRKRLIRRSRLGVGVSGAEA